MLQAVLLVVFAVLAGISAGRLVTTRDHYRIWRDARRNTRRQRRLLWRQLMIVTPLLIASSALLFLLLRGPGVPNFPLVLLVVEVTVGALIALLVFTTLRGM